MGKTNVYDTASELLGIYSEEYYYDLSVTEKKKTMDHKYKPKKVKHIIKNCGLKMKSLL